MQSKQILIAALCSMMVPSLALAHHPMSEVGGTHAEPVSFTEVAVQSARYDLDRGGTGHYGMMSLAGEWAPHRRLALGAKLPFALVSPGESGAVAGISDVTVSARGALFSSADGRFSLSVGVSTELPTGDADAGLGGGHVMLAPFVSFSSELGTPALRLQGMWMNGIALVGGGGHGDDAHAHGPADLAGSVVMPHTANELCLMHGLTLTSLGPLYAGLRNEVILKWVEPDGDVLGPVTLGGELGWNVARRVGIAMRADAPITIERRYDWRVGLATTVRF